MIILTSNGLSSDALISEARKVVPKRGKAVIITTASLGYKEKDWHIPRLNDELRSLGLSVETFDFDTQDAKRLLAYDVVEILGGNPYHLLKHMQRAANKTIIEKIAGEKVLIGISAGSIVLQKDINLVAQFNPELNDKIGLVDLTGLGLIDLEILPHYQRFLSQYKNLEELAQYFERANNCTITRLSDGEAIFVDGSHRYKV